MIVVMIITLVALGLLIMGFWKSDPVVWTLDTILWLAWSYIIFNYASTVSTANSYVPTALALIGAGFTLVCLYKDIVSIVSVIRARRGPPPMTYDEEKEANKRRIYDITRWR